MTAETVCFVAPGELEVREVEVPEPGPDEVRVEAELSAISSGTELLVYRGDVPRDLAVDETIESLGGTFSYPLRYGYAAVGRVADAGTDVAGEWLGRRVFAFHPHQSSFVVPVDDVVGVPESVDAASAGLLANLEAASNFLLDARPLFGEAVLVLGQGVVGLLTTRLLSTFPLGRLVTADRYARRRAVSEAFGADVCLDPDAVDVVDRVRETVADGPNDGVDLTFELSGDPAALSTAIGATGYGGRVVIGSWYGAKPVELDLGGRFHRSRIRILSSQVSTIAPALRSRWSRHRRRQAAASRLGGIDTDALVTHRFPIDRAADAYDLLDDRPHEAIQVLLTY